MDSLTHGLLGPAIGALRRPDSDRTAVLVACVLAAEIPDLDYLWPADNSVLHSLKAHRGLSHSLLAVPMVALSAPSFSRARVERRAIQTAQLRNSDRLTPKLGERNGP
jgi:inner membrane protein